MQTKYEPSFDGLRAIAIIPVVLYHASGNRFQGGWAGVDIFFVLSGYLITGVLKNEYANKGRINFRSFYIKRFLRLTPALIAVLLFELIRSQFFGSAQERHDTLVAIGLSAFYLMNWSRAFDWLPQGDLGHCWSLSMEEQFYMIWPLVFTIVRARKPLIWLAVALVLVTAWRSELALLGASAARTYNGFDTHSDGLIIGCIIALAPIADRVKQFAVRTALIPLFAYLAIFAFSPYHTILSQTAGLSLSAGISAWMIVGIAQGEGRLRRLLSWSPLVSTGKISYSWYLWHYPIIMLSKGVMPSNGMIRIASLFVVVLLTYVFAAASYWLVEMPFLRLKRQM